MDTGTPLLVCLSDCLHFEGKKEANSLHALVDRSSEATDTGGFFSLSTVANKARAMFLAINLFIDVNMNLEICFLPPAFSFSTLFFLFSRSWPFFMEIFSSGYLLHLSGSNAMHNIFIFLNKMIYQKLERASV